MVMKEVYYNLYNCIEAALNGSPTYPRVYISKEDNGAISNPIFYFNKLEIKRKLNLRKAEMNQTRGDDKYIK